MSLTPEQRLALIDHINALVQVDFERLVFTLNAPRSVVPSNDASQGDRSAALLAWVASPVGCGMGQLLESLGTIAPLPSILSSSRLDADVVIPVSPALKQDAQTRPFKSTELIFSTSSESSQGGSTYGRRRILLSRRQMLPILGFTFAGAGVWWLGARKTSELAPFDSMPLGQGFVYEVVTVDSRGNESVPQKKTGMNRVQLIANEEELELVEIPGGSFDMGSPADELNRSGAEEPKHRVTMEPFMMGRYPITQAQWRAIASLPEVNMNLDADGLSYFKGDNLPVERVSWYEAVEACARLNNYTRRYDDAPIIYRLPSEAEWEYACRAATATPFHFGKTLTPELANYDSNFAYAEGPTGKPRGTTTPVDTYPYANAFGLFDMHGNVWEWCQDHWHENYDGAPPDGTAWVEGGNSDRILRGGSWNHDPRRCRSAFRGHLAPVTKSHTIGFRVVLAPR